MHLIARIKTILLATSSVIVISCASSSKDIETIYVSPDQYRPLNCKSLAHELAQLNLRKNTLSAEIDKKAANDEGITAVSAILFWPAAFALGGNKEQEQEYARIKGKYDAVVRVGAEKQCNLDMSPALRVASLSNESNPVSATPPIEYYGQAEEEIKTNIYDKNLWAQALVEVEGDETKRKAKYIELRATQLYSEKAGAVSLDTTASHSGLPPAAIELRSYLAGNTSSGKTEKQLEFHVYNSPDGSMFGRTTSKYNKESQDSGTWEVNKDSQYCRKWNKWRDGKRDCFQVYALEGNKFRMKAIGKRYESIFTVRPGDPEKLGNEISVVTQSLPMESKDDPSKQSSLNESVSIIDFYGEAEAEINNDTYDKNLWAKALVESEGDETKRKARYIELRANQLYSEKAGSVSDTNLYQQAAPITRSVQIDLSGIYVSDITTNSQWVFNKPKHRRLKIIFEQQGSKITGTNRLADLKITGVREGDEITFFTWPSDINDTEIKGMWRIDPDGNRLEGTWSHPHGDGKWNLTRIE